MKNLKLFFSILFLTQIFFSYSPVLAQTNTDNPLGTNLTYSGPEATIREFLCAPTDNGAQNGDLYTCINKIYKFSIALASVIAVLFIVIGGYLYMSSEGNNEAVDKAKDILASSITALVILLSTFILLKQINPDLIKFQPIQIPKVYNPNAGGGGPTGAPATGNSQQLAQQILNMGDGKINLATAHASGNPDNANAAQNIKDEAAGQQAKNSCYTDKGITAPCKSVDLNANMLQAIINAGNSLPVKISELAGGVHSSNSAHYTGRGVDIAPQTANANTQAQLVGILRQGGATQIGLECVGGPNNGYLVLTGSNDNNSVCLGKSGYHIHAQW